MPVGRPNHRRQIVQSLALGNAHGLWHDDGVVRSMARASAQLHGMSRVGMVYTPPEHRRRGYGAAVTAAVSQWALDQGARDVVLFTDLDNPTSNSIYQKIGYRPVYDAVEYRFPTTVA
ncbi:GNAT family N-acetyltransferase [Thermocrispum agreste]|nr:GNAT family N-acetyltransferase [Thermocrispum agreste]